MEKVFPPEFPYLFFVSLSSDHFSRSDHYRKGKNDSKIKVCIPAVFIMPKRFKKCYTDLKNLVLSGE